MTVRRARLWTLGLIAVLLAGVLVQSPLPATGHQEEGSPEPPPSALGVRDHPELLVAERIAEPSGTDCFAASVTLVDPSTEVATDALVDSAGGAGNWLDAGSRFAGSLQQVQEALNGELVVAGDSWAWLIVPTGEFPYGQEVVSTLTPGGAVVWQLVDQVRSCRDPEWTQDEGPEPHSD